MHHRKPSKRRTDKSYTARKATAWVKAGKACGSGIKSGGVDSGVDTTHPAFKGVKLTYRSFKRKGEREPISVHGKAVTAMIAGNSAWGGLLPGAEVFACNVFHLGKKGKNVGSTKAILLAVDWMLTNKVSVINLSIGGAPKQLQPRLGRLGIAALGPGDADHAERRRPLLFQKISEFD